MTEHFFDSSAFAKIFIVEDGSQATIHLYSQANPKYASALLWVEVRAAIRKRQRMGEIADKVADRLTVALDAQKRRVTSIDFSPAVLAKAAELIDSRGLRSLDAVQLASALEAGKGNASIAFVSADDQLIKAAEVEGLQAINPEIA